MYNLHVIHPIIIMKHLYLQYNYWVKFINLHYNFTLNLKLKFNIIYLLI